MSTIKVKIQGSTAVVTPGVALWDELDTNKFRAVLNELLARADIKKIVLNLHSVSHLNSTALGILVQTHADVQSTYRSLILCEVKKQVGNIFEVTKLNTILDIRPKLEDAFDDDYHQRGVNQKSKLSYTFEQRDDSMIVHMDGHLIGGPDSEKLSTACKAHLEDSRVQRLVLDLADCATSVRLVLAV